MLVGRIVLAPIILFAVSVAACTEAAPPSSTPKPTVQAAPLFPTPAPTLPVPPPTTPPPPPAAATRGPRPAVIYVANTDGDGVFLRRLSAIAERIQAFPDGTPLSVIGEAIQAYGETWLPVRAPDGTEGWVPERFTSDTVPPGVTPPVFDVMVTPPPSEPAPEPARTPAPAPKPAAPTTAPAPAPAPAPPAPAPVPPTPLVPPKVFIPPAPPTGIPLPGAVPKPPGVR